MDDLAAFLKARLAEDEAVARAVTVPHEWHTGPGDDPEWTDEELVCMWPPEFHTPYEKDKHWRGLTVPGPALAAHIARHDPARVLREVEAKRRIVDAYAEVVEFYQPDPAEWHEVADGHAAALHDAVRALAAVYADHPDYRPEWAPDA